MILYRSRSRGISPRCRMKVIQRMRVECPLCPVIPRRFRENSFRGELRISLLFLASFTRSLGLGASRVARSPKYRFVSPASDRRSRDLQFASGSCVRLIERRKETYRLARLIEPSPQSSLKRNIRFSRRMRGEFTERGCG